MALGKIIANLCRLLELESRDMMIRHLLVWHKVKKKDREAMNKVLDDDKKEINGIVKSLSGGA